MAGAPRLTFRRKVQLVSTRLLQPTADLEPGFGAFRQPSQVQQCARLLNRCGKAPIDLGPRQCMLASMHMTAYLQQQSAFGTGV